MSATLIKLGDTGVKVQQVIGFSPTEMDTFKILAVEVNTSMSTRYPDSWGSDAMTWENLNKDHYKLIDEATTEMQQMCGDVFGAERVTQPSATAFLFAMRWRLYSTRRTWLQGKRKDKVAVAPTRNAPFDPVRDL